MSDRTKEPDEREARSTLDEADLRSEPAPFGRRAVLELLGAAITGSVTVLLGERRAFAQGMPPRTGCNDQDTVYPQQPDGVYHDYAGRGRHCNPQQGGGDGPSGCTDRDPTDGENFGRNCRPGASPPNTPPNTPPSSPTPTGCSDHDPTDRGGYGVNCRPGASPPNTPPSPPRPQPSPGGSPSGCTDRDPAPPRGDPGGRGRNCRRPTPAPTPSRPTQCSDTDSGPGADPANRGRRCRTR